MAIALTYTELRSTLLAMLAQAPSPYTVIPPDFEQLYPRAISYAESRICAEIPLLANRVADSSSTVTGGSRVFNLNSMNNTMIVVERVALITPGAGTLPQNGMRNQYIKTTLDYIDMFWPTEAAAMRPDLATNVGRYWAYITLNTTTPTTFSEIAIAPTPDVNYTIEVTGLVQPLALSVGNAQTYLSTFYPDLLTAACMVFLEGALMRNFGAQADDSPQALSWEKIYRGLKDACEFEEMRRRGMVPDIPRGPAPPAQPAG